MIINMTVTYFWVVTPSQLRIMQLSNYPIFNCVFLSVSDIYLKTLLKTLLNWYASINLFFLHLYIDSCAFVHRPTYLYIGYIHT